MWSKLSLRLKFLSLVLPLAICIAFVFYVLVDRQLSNEVRLELDTRIDELSAVQASSLSGPLWSFNIQQLRLVTSSMINDPDIIGVEVVDDAGKVLARDGASDLTEDRGVHLKEVPIIHDDAGTTREIGQLRLIYSENRIEEEDISRRISALSATGLLIAALIVSALLGLQYTVLTPLGRFSRAIETSRTSDDVSPVDWNTQDEMGKVAHAFNDLQSKQKSDAAALRRIQDNLEELVEKRTETLAQREKQLVRARDEAEDALEELRRTQDRLIQSQKMASLGALSAGIAHEIKNPLNFVNNFSLMSNEMLDELREAVASHRASPSDETAEEIAELTDIIGGNLKKIEHHGKRADNIVRNMLLHSREGPASFRQANVNTIVSEALNLAFHSARAETEGFNVTIEEDLESGMPKTWCVPQDLSRVFINLASNAMYATHQRAKTAPDGFDPKIVVTSRLVEGRIHVTVEDNGEGIAEESINSIFEPFYTSKPSGEGTGLGLSLAYDVVTKTHQGDISVQSTPGERTIFSVRLPVIEEEPAQPVVAAE